MRITSVAFIVRTFFLPYIGTLFFLTIPINADQIVSTLLLGFPSAIYTYYRFIGRTAFFLAICAIIIAVAIITASGLTWIRFFPFSIFTN